MRRQVAVIEAAAVAQAKAVDIEGQSRDEYPAWDVLDLGGAAWVWLQDTEASRNEVFDGSDAKPIHGPWAMGAAAGGKDLDAALPQGVDDGPGVQLSSKGNIDSDCKWQRLGQQVLAEGNTCALALSLGEGEALRAHGVAYLGTQTCVFRAGHAETSKIRGADLG